MRTNDIKKGMRFRLTNGWYGTMQDNRRGRIRLAEVEGLYTEWGSIDAEDIAAAEVSPGTWAAVTR